jgi:hypothetical protein
MNKQKINVWGREFELEVVFDYYEGEEILPTQNDALKDFLVTSDDLVQNAKREVEEYCLKRNADDIGSSSIDNIFKYVMPKSIYVQRTTVGSHVLGLMCAYKFDVENGIAVVCKNEKLDKVGTQNIIL